MQRASSRFACVALLLARTPAAFAQSHTSFVSAPPRTIAQITAIRDDERPTPSAAARVRNAADPKPPAKATAAQLAKFHYDRCIARSTLGEYSDATADCAKAVELGRGSVHLND